MIPDQVVRRMRLGKAHYLIKIGTVIELLMLQPGERNQKMREAKLVNVNMGKNDVISYTRQTDSSSWHDPPRMFHLSICLPGQNINPRQHPAATAPSPDRNRTSENNVQIVAHSHDSIHYSFPKPRHTDAV